MQCVRLSSALLLVGLLALGSVNLRAEARPEIAAPTLELVLAEVRINGIAQNVTLLGRDDAGGFYADAESIARWRLPAPGSAPVEAGGREYFPLAGFEGIAVALDERSMALDVDVPPETLLGTRRSLARASGRPDLADTVGTYLDYDIAYTRDSSPGFASLSGLLSPTVFTRRGSFSSDLLYNSQGYAYGVSDKGWRRLETTWTYDDPDRARSLRFGDAVTSGSGWGRALRFGGFQIASNFDTRPGDVTFPQPSISGTAAVPSTLDIYVNGQMRSRVEVPGGAFEINDIPVVTGAGQVQVVARDLLGREQILTQDFYSTERLLRAGLNDYSLSVGRLRQNFAAENSDYGAGLVAASLSRGITNRLTLGGQLGATSSERAFGFSLARAFGGVGLTSLSLAHSDAGRAGSLWQVGHQYQGRRFRGDIRLQGTTSGFVQPGAGSAASFAKRQVSMSAGISLRSHGSLGVSYVAERVHEGHARRISSLSYSRSLPSGFILSFATSHVATDISFNETSLSLSRSLGPRTSTSVSYSRRADGSRTRVDHRFELPSGPGYGYRTSVQKGVDDISEGEFLLNTNFARYGAEYRNNEGSHAVRVQSRGAVAFYDGAWFAAREISDAFAVVDSGGFGDVRVYLENRPIGETRADGKLLVPGLRPYEVNRLRIETADLPITARIDSPSLAVSPYFRAGTVASFGVRVTTSALMRAVTPSGDALPEGSRARVGDGEFTFPIGLDGRLYVEDLAPAVRVEVLAEGSVCVLDLSRAEFDEPFADLGDVVCVGPAAYEARAGSASAHD